MHAFTKLPAEDVETATSHIPVYDARALIKDGERAIIVLDGQTYYLRITRAGKLILTK